MELYPRTAADSDLVVDPLCGGRQGDLSIQATISNPQICFAQARGDSLAGSIRGSARTRISIETTFSSSSRPRPFHRLNSGDILRDELVVRIQPQRRFELFESRLELPLLCQRNTKIQMSTPVIRSQPNDRLKLLLCFRDFSFRHQFG